MSRLFVTTALALGLATPALANNVTVLNTFEDPTHTSGVESPNSGGAQTATIDATVEFDAVGSYFIDFVEDGTTLVMIVTDDAVPVATPMAASSYDRFYFNFSDGTPAGATIDLEESTDVLASATSVAIDNGKLVVEFGAGASVEPGNTLVVSLN